MEKAPMTTTAARAVTEIHLADAPSIPGLRFRLYDGPADHPDIVRIFNAAAEADGDSWVATVEEVDNEMANLSHGDPYRDVLVADVDRRMVAVAQTEWRDQNTGGRSYVTFGAVEPAWRRHGIGRAMLHWSERRIREIVAEVQDDGRHWFTAWAMDTSAGTAPLLASEGYVPVRHFQEMVRPDLEDIEPIALPPGLEVRPVRDADLRTIFDAGVEAFRDHWGGVDDSDAAFQRWLESPDHDSTLMVIAWDGTEVAGGVINTIPEAQNERHGYRRGNLNHVYTRRPWRRRGVARALMARSLVLLRDRGLTSASLGVDSTNPHEAVHLYESLGFRVTARATAWHKPFDPAIGPQWDPVA